MRVIKKGMTTTFVALAMAATAFTAAPAFAAGKMTISSPQDPGSWDPIDTFLVQWAAVATNIFDGLTYRGPDLKLAPGLAESWKSWMKASASASSCARTSSSTMVSPSTPPPSSSPSSAFGEQGAKGPQRSNYVAIESVDVIDDYTVDMKLKAPDPVLLTKLAGYGGMIVPPAYIKEKGEDNFNLNPVGTGAFKFVSYAPKTTSSSKPTRITGAARQNSPSLNIVSSPSLRPPLPNFRPAASTSSFRPLSRSA